MLWKIFLLSCCFAISTTHIKADDVEIPTEIVDEPIAAPVVATKTSVQHSVSFETAHKRPEDDSNGRSLENDSSFHTSHKIAPAQLARALTLNSDMDEFVDINGMNLLPTKERPELNPVLSALINEDVMKSIEAKRAIEQAELDIIKAETDAAVDAEEEDAEEIREKQEATVELQEQATEAPVNVLTTVAPAVKLTDLDDDDINVGFVDQTINLDAAGSENNKKSRIEIKKGPNGQEYEYEYVYYYEDEDADSNSASTVKESIKENSKSKGSRSKSSAAAAHEDEPTARGKSRYTNIERNGATASDNSLTNGKAKGRSSGSSKAAATPTDDVEVERLPTNTRFPSRGKNIDVPPTPALDSLENAAEKKRISVKRPSLELVDSETFNTDEKQVKGTRNGDTEAKQQKQAVPAPTKQESSNSVEAAAAPQEEDTATVSPNDDEDIQQTTPSMEKAALDLYAIIANANSDFNMEETSTDMDMDLTTILPGVTDGNDDGLTTLVDEISSTTTTTTEPTTTTTTTTTTPAPTTTTTTTAAPSLFGRRGGLGAAGRNRFKLNKGASTTTTTAPSTEPNEPVEQSKTVKNRFSRPLPGARNRGFNPKSTTAPVTSVPVAEEEEVAVKEVKSVNTGFGRGRPRNRFNLRGSTTSSTEKPPSEESASEENVSSTTARAVRGRPTLNLRGRSRLTTKAPSNEEDAAANDKNEVNPAIEEKATPAAQTSARPSRFNLNRSGGAGGNRLLPRGKFGRTTEAPTDDSAADSSHHNDVKGEGSEPTEGENAEKTDETPTTGTGSRLKVRPRLGNLHKTENPKSHAATAPSLSAAAPRKVNPLLAKRRLNLPNAVAAEATSSTEKSSATALDEAEASPKDEAKSDSAEAADSSNKDDTTESSAETPTTKQQARGLGLLGQRRRLPLRKPGTIN